MTAKKKVRLPNGDVVDRSELQTGKGCIRCDAFISVRSDLPVKPNSADFSELNVTDFAGTDHRIIGDKVSGDLCPDCRDDLTEWLNEG